MGLIYDRDGYTFRAFTGRKADDLRSWYTHQYTEEEADREKDAYPFIVARKDMKVLELRDAPTFHRGLPKGPMVV